MADGYLSDESDLYGDEEYTKALQKNTTTTNVKTYWESHNKDLNVIAFTARSEITSAQNGPIHSGDDPKPKLPKGGLHNIYEGQESAWQLNEDADDFLTRLPPRGSASVGPWLWVANPYAERDDEPESRVPSFMQQAPRLLAKYAEDHPNAAKERVTKTVREEREKLKEEILAPAKEVGMTSGKWMLFPSEEACADVWKQIVTATMESKLGIGAKIATDGATRLVCVYTKDFSDERDVKRVVAELGRMKLLPERGIYYKSDAYTYLDIGSGNEYGLQASLYASRDVLKLGREEGNGGKVPQKRQKRLDGFGAGTTSSTRRGE